MLLVYNIGNNEILFGIVQEGNLLDRFSLALFSDRTADEYACLLKGLLDFKGYQPQDFKGAIASSVVPSATETVRAAVELVCGFRTHLLGAGLRTGLDIRTDEPSQLGGDLVARAVGALSSYEAPLILIDFGTATTFSVLDKQGAFIGCAIAPGVALSSEALSNGASLLPHIAHTMPKRCIGVNTMESMQSGCIYGSVAMIDGMIERIEDELGYHATLIASGSIADSILPLCKREIKRDDSMLLRGLAEIYGKNQKKRK